MLCLIAGTAVVLSSYSSFGGTSSGKRLERVEASPHYKEGQFVNVVPQTPSTLGGIWKLTVDQFSGDQVRVPPSSIPVVPLLPESLTTPPKPGLRSVWIGHAGVLVEMDGLRFLVDPVFSERASPVGFAGPKRFHQTPISLQDLPPIDAVMISHDHYDHLDMPTIQHLSSKGTHFFVPLGIGAHLEEWGVPQDQISDMEWWDSREVGALTITSTPSRHYSGRDLFDYKKTFWSSWSIVGPEHRVYYSGDTGFSDHFQQIGERLGPFDLNIIKVGAYGPGASWLDIHMTPEQAVDAHSALGGKRMLPVHWATFNMAYHDWDEPIIRTLKSASERQVNVITPRIGEVVAADQPFNSDRWWEEVR
ncbi:MAG: L-ascorbate metabolism protein UlaG (beta-lactamase superfamily) [Halieaceae bacterium]|jgi:L-ascorbate metabolism protein UlaG (beta-lactamase superfamily)